MSMLQNNTDALVKLREMDTAALEALFGPQAPVHGTIVGALYNSDTDGMKSVLLHGNPAGVVAGLSILTRLTGAAGAELVTGCPVNEQELQANAGQLGLSLTITAGDMVDKRAHAADRLCTLDELAGLAERLMGRQPGCLVAMDDGLPQEYPHDTPVSQVVGAVEKGVLTDHRFYPAAALSELTLGELKLKSGVFHRLTGGHCAVHQADEEIARLRNKSCGKCTFCREGLYQLSRILDEVESGRAKAQGLELAREIGQAMTTSCNCTLGELAGLPVLSLLDGFGDEVDAHVKSKTCPAGVCLGLTQFYIDPALCRGEGACAHACPAHCIDTRQGYVSVIDSFDCTRCGKCLDLCPHGAVKQCSGRPPKLPAHPVRIKGARPTKETGGNRSVPRTTRRKRVYASAIPMAQPVPQAQPTETTIQKEQVKIMKTLTTDVVIVAGGPAGLAAAVTLGERGLKSILLEKSSTTGGAANMGMGPMGIDTRIQRAQFNDLSVEDALHMHMEYTHYHVDEDLVQTYFHKSADTIQWLEDMGVEFAGAFRYFKESEATWHIVKPENGVIGPRAAAPMARTLTRRAKELGCEILLETPATSLIYENGKVCGVVAVDKDGNGMEVRGKAVIVATGGFGNNKEMLKQEFGLNLGEDFFPFQIPGITGDGLKMMWDVGAAKFGANIEAIYQIPDNLNWFLLDAVLRQPNLMINQLGDRFMNEGDMGNTTYTGNAIALQPGNYGYCIMDEGILKEYKRNGPDIVDIVHPADAFLAFDSQAALAVEQGYSAYIEAKTIPELAEKLGIDEDKLRDTIEEYNAMCECGVDTKYHKPQKFLHPITGKGKYLVGKYYLAAYGTVGGVRINKYCEVLDKNHMPIEGLYSAGSDANTIYGDSYNFTLPGNSMGFAVNTGRMAGESVAEYISEL